LERPWFQSGNGEQLGVVVKPPTAALSGKPAETPQKYTSEWALDPLWNAAETAPLRASDFVNGSPSPQPRLLAEISSPLVGVVGFDPQYDPTRRLWFVDIEMSVEDFYFPFVRLALSRYQPISIEGAHLSTTVLSDFVQVAPHRWAEYDLGNVVAGGSIPVRLHGPGHVFGDRVWNGTTIVVARLERRLHGDADASEPLGWTPIESLLLDQVPGVGGHDVAWEGALPLPSALPTPLRVSLLEAQVLRADSGNVQDLLRTMQRDDQPTGSVPRTSTVGASLENFGYRVVFADATVALP